MSRGSEKATAVNYEVIYPTLNKDLTMKLTIVLTSLVAFICAGSQFCYAEDLLDTVLNTCISYVHKQYQIASLMLISLIVARGH